MEDWTHPAAQRQLPPKQRPSHRRCPRSNASRIRWPRRAGHRQLHQGRKLSAPMHTWPIARGSLTGSAPGRPEPNHVGAVRMKLIRTRNAPDPRASGSGLVIISQLGLRPDLRQGIAGRARSRTPPDGEPGAWFYREHYRAEWTNPPDGLARSARRFTAISPKGWCCRWVSNLRPLPYQGLAAAANA